MPPWPSRPALFLDLDGTLLEFAEHPDLVAPSERLRAILPSLSPATEGAIAMISGRPIASLDRLLAPHRFPAAGIHGLERRKADGTLLEPDVDEALLRRTTEAIRTFISERTGLFLEDKHLSLALHYRQRPDLEAEVLEFAASLRSKVMPQFEILLGKSVVEVKPSGVDKGRAIASFMREEPFRGRTPVFIGDDVTDETGFEVVKALGGVTIKVDASETIAEWHLHDVTAVLGWLEAVIAFTQKPPASDRTERV
jgi:trehalose 6-phosphate phosphatase